MIIIGVHKRVFVTTKEMCGRGLLCLRTQTKLSFSLKEFGIVTTTYIYLYIYMDTIESTVTLYSSYFQLAVELLRIVSRVVCKVTDSTYVEMHSFRDYQ